MKKNAFLFFATALALITMACENERFAQQEDIAIFPKPRKLEASEGHFKWDKNVNIKVEDQMQEKIAQLFLDQFEKPSGWRPKIVFDGGAEVELKTNPSMGEEAYRLEVVQDSIQIEASTGAGFFYAFQSLKQLFPAPFFNREAQNYTGWKLPLVSIEDSPEFGWRGYMLDVSRHFFDVGEVKKVLDFMAELKLNRFHWHLTDDQGWRIAIKSYPKLTQVGAWRMDYNTSDESISKWWGRPAQQLGEKPTYGGFYTQEQIKEVVDYAKERFIEVIPEIDMPGHAQAAIAAYPEIGCVNAAPYVATGGVYKNNTYNPGKEAAFLFAEKVLNEVMDLFPFDYVHIGGDECSKEQWKIDPDAQRRIKEEGLKDEYELQSYFIGRIEKIISARNKILIGWDEILEGGLVPKTTVMSWRGEEGGIESVKMGHEVIMTPNSYCYIDLKQGHDDLEPNLGYSQLLLSKSYGYKVIPEDLSHEEAKLIKGIQANLWTESINDWDKLTYMTFPRLYAIAETAWTPHYLKNWDDFCERLPHQFDRLEVQNQRYAVSAFSPWIAHNGNGEKIEIAMHTEATGLDVHYTLDGSEPTPQSERYSDPFEIHESANIKAQSFKNGHPFGYTSNLSFPIHKGTKAKISSETGPKKVEVAKLKDLNYAKLDNNDPNWVPFENGLNIMVEFEDLTEVRRLTMNALRFTVSRIYLPSEITVLGSEDGKTFSELCTKDLKPISNVQGRNKVEIECSFEPTRVKSLRILAKTVSPIPHGHHAAGESSKILIDEIVLN